MPIRSVLTVVDATEAIADRVQAAADITTDALTDEQLASISASMDGARSDVRAVLAELDTTDEESLVVTGDARSVIGMWRWRRRVRRGLVDLAGRALTVQDLAAGFTDGTPDKVVVSRQGDTLQKIAARELGSWAEWPRLLEANPDLAPGAVLVGTQITIPVVR